MRYILFTVLLILIGDIKCVTFGVTKEGKKLAHKVALRNSNKRPKQAPHQPPKRQSIDSSENMPKYESVPLIQTFFVNKDITERREFSAHGNSSMLNRALVEVLGEPESMKEYQKLSAAKSIVRKRCWDYIACELNNVDFELENIVIENGQLYITNPDFTTKQLIEEFGNDRLPPVRVLMEGKVGQAFLSGPKINIVKESPTCSQHHDWLYFHWPWLPRNAFHTVNDNIFAILYQIAVQHLAHPKPLLSRRTLVMGVQPNKQIPLFNVLKIFFDDVIPISNIMKANEPICVKRMTWFNPPKIFYRSSLENLRRALKLIFQNTLSQFFGRSIMDPSLSAPLPSIVSDAASSVSSDTTTKPSQQLKPLPKPLRAIIISRNGPSKQGQSTRCLHKDSEAKLLAALRNKGIKTTICNFQGMSKPEHLWSTFSDIDICIGIHGAGLTNCALMRDGGLVVELQATFAYGFTGFMMMAFMSKSNYLHVDMRPHIAPRQRVDITLEDEAVESIAKLAVAARKKGGYINETLSERWNHICGDKTIFKPPLDGSRGYLMTPDPLVKLFLYPDTSLKTEDLLGPVISEEKKDCEGRIYHKLVDIVHGPKPKKPHECARSVSTMVMPKKEISVF